MGGIPKEQIITKYMKTSQKGRFFVVDKHMGRIEQFAQRDLRHPVFTGSYAERLDCVGGDPRTLETLEVVREKRPDMLSTVMEAAGLFVQHTTQKPHDVQIFRHSPPEDRRFQQILASITAELRTSSAVAAVGFRNLGKITAPENGQFTLAAEFCPLYLPGTLDQSRLHPNPTGVESIERSRVGGKWITTTHVLRVLNSRLREKGIRLRVNATFGDIGVLVATPHDANPDIVKKHSEAYRDALRQFCKNEDIGLSYKDLSEIEGPTSPVRQVEPFVIVGNGTTAKTAPPIEELLQYLGIPPSAVATEFDRRQAKVLYHSWQSCNGNVSLWKGLLNTYIWYVGEAIKGSDLHLGMERADWLLAIQSFPRGAPLEQIPTLHVRVP